LLNLWQISCKKLVFCFPGLADSQRRSSADTAQWSTISSFNFGTLTSNFSSTYNC
jgi:hypothetical protein